MVPYRTSFSVLEGHFPVLEHPFLLCPVLSRVPSWILAILAHPVLNIGSPGLSPPLARLLACPVVSLSRDNEGTSVPLSQKVSSCPVPLETLCTHFQCIYLQCMEHSISAQLLVIAVLNVAYENQRSKEL